VLPDPELDLGRAIRGINAGQEKEKRLREGRRNITLFYIYLHLLSLVYAPSKY